MTSLLIYICIFLSLVWPYPACALTVTKRKGPFCNLVFFLKNELHDKFGIVFDGLTSDSVHYVAIFAIFYDAVKKTTRTPLLAVKISKQRRKT